MAANEALTLDSLALNDGTTYTLEQLTLPVPSKRPEWITGADSEGAVLGRDPLFENRVIEARIRIEPQSTKDLALAKIAAIEDKFEECERQANGLALTWVPADATTAAITFRCLSGEITDLPIDIESGWFVKAPIVGVRMTCLPFGEGAETQIATVTSSAPIITLELTSVAGAAQATGRLVVLDAASKDRRYIVWGLESRYYPTSSPPSLIVDSASMVTSGYSGTTANLTGAYSGATNNVITVNVTPSQVTAVCGLPVLTHVGAFRVFLRCHTSANGANDGPYVRLTYQANDGPFRSLPFKQLPAASINHVDLGMITVPETVAGTQKWTGRIEAYDVAAVSSFSVDAIWLVPVEQYGKAVGRYSYAPGAVVGYDNFTSIATGTALNARVAPLGGTWTTSGGATDIAASDLPVPDETMRRATVSDGAFPANARHARLGASNYTNIEVGADIHFDLHYYAIGQGLLARWVDVSNFVTFGNFVGSDVCGIYVYVAGALVARTDLLTEMAIDTWHRLRLVVYASGMAIGTLLDRNGAIIEQGTLSSSVLATGGTLATGRPGFIDTNLSTQVVNRYYDNYYHATPNSEPVVCYSGQTIEFRSDTVIREDSTGTYYGMPPEYVGAYFTVPCAGGPARKSRIAIMARKTDVEQNGDDTLTSNATIDSTTVTAFASPRYLSVPR